MKLIVFGIFLVSLTTCIDNLDVNGGKMNIKVSMVNTTHIKFTLTGNSGDWLGIGFGSNMKNHDMFYVSGGNFHDTYSTGNSKPSDDTDQADYTFLSLGGGVYEITRPLTSLDTNEDENIASDTGV